MRATFAFLAVLLTGCAGRAPWCCAPCPPPCPSVASAPAPDPTPPAPAARALPAPGTILDHRTGDAVPFEKVLARLETVPVVYVGEQHDQAEIHRFQTRVLEALAARPGGPLALGMEMFYRPYQPFLDAYVRGDIDEAAMLEKTEWKTRWGFGWEMYAPMVRFCREKKIPVVALNAEKEVTRAVSKGGLEGLTPEQRASLPPLDMTDQAHRAFVRDAFGAHGAAMPADRFERFYTAQVIWEEVMSTSVADWLAKAGKDARMVVVAGNGHVADRFGVPARAGRKSGRPYLTIVTRALPGPGEEGEGLGRMDTTYADYTAYFLPSAPPPPPRKSAPTSTAPVAPPAPKT